MSAGGIDIVAPPVAHPPSNVLLRLPNWVGDIVMAAPTVAAIHAACPDARLTASVRPAFAGLARHLPGVGAVLPAGRDRSLSGLRDSASALRAAGFDAAVVFPRGVRAALAPRLARIPVRVGFGGRGRRLLLTHPVLGWRPARSAHRSAFFGLLAAPFGSTPAGPWRLEPPAEALEAADRLRSALGGRRDRPLVVLEGGSSYGPAKCWPPERFGQLGRRLADDGADVLAVGTDPEEEAHRRMLTASRGGMRSAAGRTPDLGTLAALLARASLVVANDTGPMHLAAAVGAPLLALFGATDPVVSGPAGHGSRTILWEPEPCSPCFLRTCAVPGHPCLSRFGVERVHAAARRILDG